MNLESVQRCPNRKGGERGKRLRKIVQAITIAINQTKRRELGSIALYLASVRSGVGCGVAETL